MILLTSLALLSLSFFSTTTLLTCRDEIVRSSDKSFTKLEVDDILCRVYRYSQEQNIYPSKDMFLLRADAYYEEFNRDYLGGRVALFGGSRIGVFEEFIDVQHPETTYVETNKGWYSIDGRLKDMCVMELGQVDSVKDNYRKCGTRYMSREIFD